jgi:hypothetical protein
MVRRPCWSIGQALVIAKAMGPSAAMIKNEKIQKIYFWRILEGVSGGFAGGLAGGLAGGVGRVKHSCGHAGR